MAVAFSADRYLNLTVIPLFIFAAIGTADLAAKTAPAMYLRWRRSGAGLPRLANVPAELDSAALYTQPVKSRNETFKIDI
jgi:hypothetical protein